MILTLTLNPSLDEWIDLPRLAVGALNRATSFTRYPGGKGLNVSRVVRTLGGKTLAVALAGGSDGAILSRSLDALKLPHRFLTVPGLTRNNYKIRTASPRALTQINSPGPRVSASSLRKVQRLIRQLSARASAVVCSGSLPPGAPVATYRRFIAPLSRRGCLTVLDTSGPALKAGLAAHPWLIKPNLEELQELLGRRVSGMGGAARAARQLVERGPALALVSLGKAGAVLAVRGQQEVLVAKAPAVRVQSTVGAGDSLVAGFLTGWLRTRSAQEAFRLGMACGVAAVLTPGTELCRRQDVERLLGRIRISRL